MPEDKVVAETKAAAKKEMVKPLSVPAGATS